MKTLRRYLRAFYTALVYTLRGQRPPTLEAEERHRELLAWCRETLTRVDAVNETLQTHGVSAASIVMRIEGRDVSLETALETVRFHAAREYPQLIRSGSVHTALGIQATNLNDRFLLERLRDHEALSWLIKTALDGLIEQLVNIVKEY
jgi:hypothetical protein